MRKSIRDAILREAKAAQAILDLAETENRELSDVERDKANEHVTKAKKLEEAGLREIELATGIKAFTENLGLAPDEGGDGGGTPPTVPTQGGPVDGKRRLTVGDQFVKSAEWQAFCKSVPNGVFSEKMRVQSGVVNYKALLTGADHTTSAGSLFVPDFRGMLDPMYQIPLVLRNLVSNGQTMTDTIEYVRMNTPTNNAAPVPEATSSAPVDGTTVTNVAGGVKPESAMSWVKESTTVKTIAHWIPATKRALADAAQIRGLIDNFLRYGLEDALERQMLTGDGTGENFLGLDNVSGVLAETPGTGDDVFTVTRRAISDIQVSGFTQPNAFVMNPADWTDVELQKSTMGVYYAGGPFRTIAPSLWGLPVVLSQHIPAGTAWCANWNWATLWDREQASVQITDSHADFFIRNLVAVLAEMRAAFGVLRPQAFCKITLPA